MKRRLSPLASLSFLFLLTVGLFAVLFTAPALTWDDDSNIFKNPHFLSGDWRSFWTAPYFGLYIPLTNWVWQVVFIVGGGAVWPFRVLNLSLHLINIALVYVLLRQMSKNWQLREEWPLAAAVALFAWHPVQVETVAWLSGGRDLLGATFALSTIIIYFSKRGWGGFALSTLFFAAAVLTKPNNVILPVIVFVIEAVRDRGGWSRAFGKMLGWMALTLWPIQMTLAAQESERPSVDWLYRPWIMLDAYSFYLRKLIWPWPLSANYARTPDVVLAQPTTWAWGLATFLVLALVFIWGWRRERRLSLFGLWFLLLLPVSGLVSFGFQRISTTADHYLYTPMAVVSAVALIGLNQIRQRQQLAQFLTNMVLVAFFIVAHWRVDVWRSDAAFFSDMAEVSPDSYATAVGMSIVKCLDEKDYDSGVRWTETALAARPDDILALANQAYCFLHAGNYFRVTELEFYLNRLDLEDLENRQPTAYASLLASIGTAEVELKELEIGYQYLCEAYRVKPSEPSHQRNLELATSILRSQGYTPSCDPDFPLVPEDPEDEYLNPDEESEPAI